MPGLIPEPWRAAMGRPRFSLVVFDKGGTLIDFRAMWCDWAIEIARRLEAQVGFSIANRFFVAIGFDPRSGYIDPLGKLAVLPVSGLRALTPDVLVEAGLEREAAEAAVARVWFTPDPAASARPLADLPALFRVLRERGVKIAIATMDGRASTEGGLAALSLQTLVDAVVCGDDGLPHKPAPDMVWAACRAVGVSPLHTVVVGDSITDMQMGRSAGAGLNVGVLSGVTLEEFLAPYADVLIADVSELM
jgi:phosphoglycolate phosphatase-like HAD superfamily hydrolase